MANVDRVPGGTRVTPGQFTKEVGKKRLVVQEELSLNVQDWNANIESSMFTVLENHPGAVLVKVPKSNLPSYRLGLPSMHPYSAAQKSTLRLIRNAGYRYPTSSSSNSGDQAYSDDDDKIAENLYVLFVKENETVCR